MLTRILVVSSVLITVNEVRGGSVFMKHFGKILCYLFLDISSGVHFQFKVFTPHVIFIPIPLVIAFIAES